MILAELSSTQTMTIGLTALVVPIVVNWMVRSARKESAAASESRVVKYAGAAKAFVIAGWVVTAVTAGLALATARGENVLPAAGVVGLFFVLTLVLHLEIFGVQIRYDDENMYVRSGWRRARIIPLSAVRQCDFSQVSKGYRIHTDGYGIVRLPSFLTGVPGLLKVLPCATPQHPPQ